MDLLNNQVIQLSSLDKGSEDVITIICESETGLHDRESVLVFQYLCGTQYQNCDLALPEPSDKGGILSAEQIAIRVVHDLSLM